MSAADYAAWYGAIVATGVAAWEVFVWTQSGPRIRVEAHAGWRLTGEKGDVLVAKVVNVGDQPTTLTGWGMYWYPRGVRWYEKSRRRGFVLPGRLGSALPYKLEPGSLWMGVSDQDHEVSELLASGDVYFAFGVSHSEKEVVVRVKVAAKELDSL